MGGTEPLRLALQNYQVLLAAHGPYTAAGVSDVLGLPVTCVSQNSASFDGLISALEAHYEGLEEG